MESPQEELGKVMGIKKPRINEYGEIVRPGYEKKDPLKEQRIADGRARFQKWEERLYLILGTPEHFGRVAQQKQEQVGQGVNKLKDAAAERIDSWKNKLIDVKDSITKRVNDAVEAGRVVRDNTVEAFFDKVDVTRKFAREKADAISAKAEAIKSSTAKKIARGAEMVVGTTELVVGTGAAVVMGGVYLGERAVKWTLRETQSFPREMRAKAREGLSSISREVGKGLLGYSDRKRSEARSDRSKAASARKRFA